MGMFDNYTPVPALNCPACKCLLDGWQGKGGPCLLISWTQGTPTISEGGQSAKEERLADGEFYIYTSCERCSLHVNAVCLVEAHAWVSTKIELPYGSDRLSLVTQAIRGLIENTFPYLETPELAEALRDLGSEYTASDMTTPWPPPTPT